MVKFLIQITSLSEQLSTVSTTLTTVDCSFVYSSVACASYPNHPDAHQIVFKFLGVPSIHFTTMDNFNPSSIANTLK